jgi:hypothetical protein
LTFTPGIETGAQARPAPPEPESSFAVAVFELTSQKILANVSVTDFVLFNRTDEPTKSKRPVRVEVFDRVRPPGQLQPYSYYLSHGDTRPWEGTLPASTIRLRVAVLQPSSSSEYVRYRLRVGPHVVEGTCTGPWPLAP